MKKDFINLCVWHEYYGYISAQSDSRSKFWTKDLERAAYWKREDEAYINRRELIDCGIVTSLSAVHVMNWNQVLIQELMES
jgi:G:T-mismatch repair DNA endonuclease (very short patch repair protein)